MGLFSNISGGGDTDYEAVARKAIGRYFNDKAWMKPLGTAWMRWAADHSGDNVPEAWALTDALRAGVPGNLLFLLAAADVIRGRDPVEQTRRRLKLMMRIYEEVGAKGAVLSWITEGGTDTAEKARRKLRAELKSVTAALGMPGKGGDLADATFAYLRRRKLDPQRVMERIQTNLQDAESWGVQRTERVRQALADPIGASPPEPPKPSDFPNIKASDQSVDAGSKIDQFVGAAAGGAVEKAGGFDGMAEKAIETNVDSSIINIASGAATGGASGAAEAAAEEAGVDEKTAEAAATVAGSGRSNVTDAADVPAEADGPHESTAAGSGPAGSEVERQQSGGVTFGGGGTNRGSRRSRRSRRRTNEHRNRSRRDDGGVTF